MEQTDNDVALIALLKQLDSRDLAVLQHLAMLNQVRSSTAHLNGVKADRHDPRWTAFTEASLLFGEHFDWLKSRNIPFFLDEKENRYRLGSYM